MSDSLNKLGVRYKGIGLDPNPDFVSNRISVAEGILEKLSNAETITLARVALRLSVDDLDLAWLLKPFEDADVTFRPQNSDVEVALVACSLLRAAMEDGHASALSATLAVSCGTVGGLRPSPQDPDLGSLASSVLAREQQRSAPKLRRASSKTLDLNTLLAQIKQAGLDNNFSTGAPPLVQAVTSLQDRSQTNNVSLVRALNSLIAYVNELDEQMQIQWWVVAGWSDDASRSFRELPAAEAALRAGKELADLTSLPAGPVSSKGLLDLLLRNAAHSTTTEVSIGDVAQSADKSWREQWVSGIDASSAMPLCPVTVASAFAAQADDAQDWKPRFEREMCIEPSAMMPLVAVANQVLLESRLRELATL